MKPYSKHVLFALTILVNHFVYFLNLCPFVLIEVAIGQEGL